MLDSVSLAPKQEIRYHPSPHWPGLLDWSVGAFFVAFSLPIPVDLTTAPDLLNMYEIESSHK
jgi:hypothetical protein